MSPPMKEDPRLDAVKASVRQLVRFATGSDFTEDYLVTALAKRELGAYTAGYITGAKHQVEGSMP